MAGEQLSGTLTVYDHGLGPVLLTADALDVALVSTGEVGRGIEQSDGPVAGVRGGTGDGIVGVDASHQALHNAPCPQLNDPLVNWRRVIVQKPFNDQHFVFLLVEGVYAVQDNGFFGSVLQPLRYVQGFYLYRTCTCLCDDRTAM